MFGLNAKELKTMRSLDTPEKLQDFLDALPINFEPEGDTLFSPRMVLRHRRAHCIEAALFAGAALLTQKKEALLMSLHATPDDCDHIVTLFRKNGLWGALSKSNMPVLRYRDPIYRTPRELALSYFHEYTKSKTGKKTLRTFSKPFDLKRCGEEWITSEEPLWDLAIALYDSPHTPLFPRSAVRHLRTPSHFEIVCSDITEWNRNGKKNQLPNF